ncbi:cytochrome P450, partial [Lactifluus volemus]
YPDIQKRELDTVTSRERLPTFEDRPRLPFVDAGCKEVLRWRPVAPLGSMPLVAAPHTTMEDIVYKGYFIPKGAKAILHNSSLYPEPEVFNPERFLDPDGSLQEGPRLTSAFGYGMRICPGWQCLSLDSALPVDVRLEHGPG